jgi:transcription-repair coupling factor (superfamily II helicase)
VSAPSLPIPATRAAAWVGSVAGHPQIAEARRLLSAEGFVALHGLAGPARLLVPLLVSGPPLLVVVSTERLVERVTEDLRTLAQEAGAPGAVLALPAPGPAPFRGLPRHPEAALRRAAAVHAALRGRLSALVASPAGLLRPILAPRLFETRVIVIESGEDLTPEILLEALDEGGYRREDPVSAPGQVARRGGILDVFPPDRETPVRIEFLGDTVESLRTFDPETQRTTGALDRLEVLPLSDAFAPRSVLDGLRRLLPERFAGVRELSALLERIERGLAGEEIPELLPLVPGATVAPWDVLPGWTVAALDPETIGAEADAFHERAHEERARREDPLALAVDEVLVPAAALEERIQRAPAIHVREVDLEARGLHLASRPPRRYAGDLRALASDLRSDEAATVLFLGTHGRADRLKDVLREDGLSVGDGTRIEVRLGVLGTGFELPDLPLRVLADGDVFPEEVHLHRRRGRGARSFLSDFRDLKVGDLVVHQDHGIGRFEGLETIEVGGLRREFMVLVYQGGDKLKVPVESFDRVQKYASAEGARPIVDKLGSGTWEKTKRRVKKAMRDMAAELLKLYAERKARPGHAFTGESPWQREFEESFEYEETPDQAAAIADVMQDMSDDAPMDRLICGDVGYGKTEVAMRGAMRAVLDAKQVAVLAPTTILAFQHWKTFRKRFAPFPVRVEMVSRFRTAREIKAVLKDTAEGKVDVLIGTHRLLSKDVGFRDLGLLVIDEEQRFGVAAKEKLKHMRTTVDALTLSATPIPRTLQMGLAGIRDMSVIETPPKDRLAIQTSIVKFSTDVIATAIRQELARDGQVYFVHNRVESIYALAGMVQKLVPEARVAVAHGQMPEAELEKAMLAFVEGRADVLVATTIIENGLDIPRANTMIINRADRYGLAQLYQLRGRVGRSERRASAFLMVPPDTVLSEIARKRLAAMREFSELGAGFRVAALDLELRGAGNLLGGEQSGHIEAVGLDLYVKLLEQTILELKGQAPRDSPRTVLNLRVDLRIPEQYVPEVHQRMSLYKRVSQVRDVAEVATLAEELRDRYGPFPPEVEGLLGYAALRMRAEALGVVQVDLGTAALHLRLAPETPLGGATLAAAVRAWPGATLSPAGVLRAPVAGGRPGPVALGEVLEALEGVLEGSRRTAV